jgi:chromosome segregation ATPase
VEPGSWFGLASMVVTGGFAILNRRLDAGVKSLKEKVVTLEAGQAACRREHEETKTELKECQHKHAEAEARQVETNELFAGLRREVDELKKNL